MSNRLLSAAVASLAAVTLVFQVTACSSSSSGSAPSTAAGPTNLGSAISTALARAAQGAPHVVTSSTVTAAIDKPSLLKRVIGALLPEAWANTISAFGGLWDPESGSPPSATDLGLVNNYLDSSVLYGCTTSNGSTGAATTGGANLCYNGTYYYMFTGANGTGSKIPTSVSIKDYIGQQLDPNFVNANGSSTSTFGRLSSSMNIACALGYIFPTMDADGTPAVTAGTAVTLPAAGSKVFDSVASGGCGISASYAGGSIGTVTVAAVSGSSLYSKVITMTSPASTTLTIYVGLNLTAGTMSLMQIEDQAPAGRNAVDRSILAMSGMNSQSTNILKYEYASMGYTGSRGGGSTCYVSGNWQCSYEFHRIFVDNANDVAYVLTNAGNPGDNSGGNGVSTFYVQFSGAAKPNELAGCSAGSCSQTLALSVGMAGQSQSAPDDYNGCVNAASRAVTVDDTLSCSLTGTTINSGDPTGVIELSRQFYAQTTSATPNILTGSGTTTVSFTGASDFFTAATTQ